MATDRRTSVRDAAAIEPPEADQRPDEAAPPWVNGLTIGQVGASDHFHACSVENGFMRSLSEPR